MPSSLTVVVAFLFVWNSVGGSSSCLLWLFLWVCVFRNGISHHNVCYINSSPIFSLKLLVVFIFGKPRFNLLYESNETTNKHKEKNNVVKRRLHKTNRLENACLLDGMSQVVYATFMSSSFFLLFIFHSQLFCSKIFDVCFNTSFAQNDNKIT